MIEVELSSLDALVDVVSILSLEGQVSRHH